jgi:methyltransferase (TIGR00027 family)
MNLSDRAGAGVSRTGQAVALVRATLDRPHTELGDPDAQRRLCEGMAPAPVGDRAAGIAARTEFFDEQLWTALAVGVRQVVICGAGYDDRALRFRTSGVRFFELDSPDTQLDKAYRLRSMRADTSELTLAPIDFSRDDVLATLASCGHQADLATLFLCEGLLIYLDHASGARLLGGLRQRASTGSVLAVSLAVHAAGLASGRVVAAANADRLAGASEPWRTILPAEAYLRVLGDAGWRVDRTVDVTPPRPDARGRTLLATAHPG